MFYERSPTSGLYEVVSTGTLRRMALTLTTDERTELERRASSRTIRNPPQHAVVFAADEKTAIQDLDRLDPVLRLSPGPAERHGFKYVRHGTLSLFAALNTQTAEVLGQTVPRHTSEAFVAFLGEIVASRACRAAAELHPRGPVLLAMARDDR